MGTDEQIQTSQNSNHVLLPPAVCSLRVCPDKRQYWLIPNRNQNVKLRVAHGSTMTLPSLPAPIPLLCSLWLAGVTVGRWNYSSLFYRVTYLSSLPSLQATSADACTGRSPTPSLNKGSKPHTPNRQVPLFNPPRNFKQDPSLPDDSASNQYSKLFVSFVLGWLLTDVWLNCKKHWQKASCLQLLGLDFQCYLDSK